MNNLLGSAVNIFGVGVLITGKSGIGKSDLGLSLLDRGHKFIADDFVEIDKRFDTIYMLNSRCEFKMHIRGIGIFDVSTLYLEQEAVLSKSKLDLVIELTDDLHAINHINFNELITTCNILDVDIKKIILTIKNRTNLVLLIETIIKVFKYNSVCFQID